MRVSCIVSTYLIFPYFFVDLFIELWPALLNHYPPHGAASAGDMQAELEIARELRRIGDEFNQLYFHEVRSI